MFSFLKSRWHSIAIAFEGVQYLLRTQRNAWIHAAITLFVLVMGAVFRITRLEWIVILLTIAVVWATESLNTAMEVLIDFVSPEQRPMAKTCKDVSAAGVLIASLVAIVIGVLIFGPYVWRWLQYFFS